MSGMDDYGSSIPPRPISSDDADAIARVLVDRLAGTRFISPDEHYEHHRWTSDEMASSKEVRELRAWAMDKMLAERRANEDKRVLILDLKKKTIGAVALAGIMYLLWNIGDSLIAFGTYLASLKTGG